jgi:hypothetical protein
MAARPEIITSQSPLKTYYFDSSYYLDEVRDSLPYRKNIFPVPPEKTSDNAVYRPVFIQEDYSGVNQANGSYKVYLNSEINTISREAEYSAVWIPALLILSLLLLAWIKLIYVQFLTPVLISAFNYKESVKLFHGKNAPAQNAFLILQIIFAINSGLFLLFVSGFSILKMPDIKPSILFLISSASIVFLYTFKFGALRFLGFLFEKKKLFSEYRYNISLYNKILRVIAVAHGHRPAIRRGNSLHYNYLYRSPYGDHFLFPAACQRARNNCKERFFCFLFDFIPLRVRNLPNSGSLQTC